ncbi:MAG: hypothetical protein ACRD21_28225 [Vicinamibacteria bacterium]
MAIEIRIESTWDTDDGEGRRVEVTVAERRHPAEDPLEDTRYFASGDVETLKRYLCDLLDRKQPLFLGPPRRECGRCGNIVDTEDRVPEFLCENCRPLAR